MKIVVTDGSTLNPGDLSWDALSEFGKYEVYPAITKEEMLERCKDTDIAITNKVIFDAKVMDALPKLKYIGVTATGYNIVDIQAAKRRSIIVTNVPTYGTASVSQMTMALLLELCHHVGDHSRTVHEGKWASQKNFCYWDHPLIELEGMTMGIVGCGRIGLATAKLADAFGMKLFGYDSFPVKTELPIKMVDLDLLFKQSDVITLHCPLIPETDKIVNAQNLAKMKNTALLLNTSRGPLIDDKALAKALNDGVIAGAGLDVLSIEPPSSGNPLLTAKNCYITPHIAWATYSARKRLMDTTFDNLRAFINGSPQNVVSK